MAKFVLRISDETMEQIKVMAEARHWSINTYISEAAVMAVERSLAEVKPFANVNIQPGEDIIVQKRNGLGRFEKRG